MTPSGLSRPYQLGEHSDGHILWPRSYMAEEVGVASHSIAQYGNASKTGAHVIAALAAIGTPEKLRCIARACGRDA
jgi:hypothetical protein